MPTSDDQPKATRWAGVPAADRVAERRSLLLASALELLGTEGWSATSVRAICQSARLNPRYFYESFDDLDDLVVALYDQLVAELHAEVTTAVQAVGEDSRAVLRAVVATTVRFVDEDHRRARVLYVEALGNEKLNRRRLETGFSIAGYVQADTARRNAPASEQVGMLTGSILVGGFSELLLAWTDGVLEVDREQLVEDATELFGAMAGAAAAIAKRRRK